MRAWTMIGVGMLAVASVIASRGAPASEAVKVEQPAAQYASREQPLMGTTFRVNVQAPDSPAVREALQACFALFTQVDQRMSEWKPDSPVSEVNRQAGIAPVAIPDPLFDVLRTARRISEASSGAFDITWAALRGLWRFDGSNTVPSAEAVAERLSLLNWRELVLDPEKKTAFLKRKGMAIGLGGIAKGYALQIAADELRRRGFRDFMLYAGGQVYAGGKKSDGQPWKVGIRDPAGARDGYLAVVDVQDASLATSGDYENAFTRDGMVYHHIIDPRTGFPARLVRSASVLASDATLADACSTAAFVLGPEKGLEFARRMGVEVLLLDVRGEAHMTDGFHARLSWSRIPTKRQRTP